MMKRFILIGTMVFALFVMLGCNGAEDTNDRPTDAKITLLQFPHLDGYGNEVMRDMPILFEYEMRDYVKYQVAFVSCTCRAPRVNYWSVIYYDISKETGEVLFMSFSNDGTGDYTAGMWGDSDPIPGTGKTYQDFRDTFIPWLIGKNSSDLEGINIFYDTAPSQYSAHANTTPIDEPDLIDAYAGSSVSTNNFIRVTKTLLEYHDEKYMD